MYDIPYFKSSHPEEVFAFMQAHPFALICGVDDENRPVATQVPLLFEEREQKLFLQGHFMKKQDHTNAFLKNENVLVIFSGAHSYVSASWYTNPKVASTWNYQSVQVSGKIHFKGDDFLYGLLVRLTEAFEKKGSPALVQNMDPDYVRQMMKAIVAFEMEVVSIEHVFKLSQNRDIETQEKIISNLKKEGGDAGEIAKAIEKNSIVK